MRKWFSIVAAAIVSSCVMCGVAFADETETLSIGENPSVAQQVAMGDIDVSYLIDTLEMDESVAQVIASVPDGLRDEALIGYAKQDELYDVDANGVDIQLPYATCSVIVNDSCGIDLSQYDCTVEHDDLLKASACTFSSMHEAKVVYDDLLEHFGATQVAWNASMEQAGDMRAMTFDTAYGGYKGMNVIESGGMAEYAGSVTTNRAKVAVVDSGILTSHQIFSGLVISEDSVSTGPAGSSTSVARHGTMCAGTFAQGVPDGTELVDVQITGTSTFGVLSACQYAESVGCDVASVSWLTGNASAATLAYWDNVFAGFEHTIVVCAAGNDNVEIGQVKDATTDGAVPATDPVELEANILPACCDNVITITSSERNFNYGDPVDFDVYSIMESAYISDDSAFYYGDGTSNSTPQAAAFVANLRALGVPKDKVYDCMKAMSTDMLDTGWDAKSGWGRPCFNSTTLKRFLSRETVEMPTPGQVNTPTTPAGPTTPATDPTVPKNGDTKTAQNITFAAGKTFSKPYSRTTFSLRASADGKLSYKSSNTNVVRVSSTGQVRTTGLGTATIKVTAAETNAKKMATDTVSVTVTQGIQGLSLSPMSTKTVAYSATKARTLKVMSTKGAETTVKYAKASVSSKAKAKYFKVNAKTGKLTVAKKCPRGTYKVKIKANAKKTKLWKAKSAATTVKVKVR